jgi:hypothetical protein
MTSCVVNTEKNLESLIVNYFSKCKKSIEKLIRKRFKLLRKTRIKLEVS